ncbi:MAG: hypothetical protein KF833_22120 [Verrucomicrobiae bacterium]|nr:hypothetical protein [Verrucomicrobiae bacterium]
MTPRRFMVLALGGGVLVAEFVLGYALWMRQSRQSAIHHTLGEVRLVLEEFADRPRPVAVRVLYEPESMYRPDPLLGYSSRPGVYQVTLTNTAGGEARTFRVTIDEAGRRVTSAAPGLLEGRPEIWVMGNSFVYGWGNDDETTLGAFLQRYFPDRRVVNYAESGYGNVHGYLQMLRDLPMADPAPQTVVVGYADYYNERNVAAASRLQTFRRGLDRTGGGEWQSDPAEFTHPRARLVEGRLEIDRVPLFPEASGRSQRGRDPSLDEQYEVTCRLLEEMAQLGSAHGVRLVLGFLQGGDDDPAVTCAEAHGYLVADLRPDYNRHEWDDFQPLDGHPGPVAQSIYAWKLFRALMEGEEDGVGSLPAQ